MASFDLATHVPYLVVIGFLLIGVTSLSFYLLFTKKRTRTQMVQTYYTCLPKKPTEAEKESHGLLSVDLEKGQRVMDKPPVKSAVDTRKKQPQKAKTSPVETIKKPVPPKLQPVLNIPVPPKVEPLSTPVQTPQPSTVPIAPTPPPAVITPPFQSLQSGMAAEIQRLAVKKATGKITQPTDEQNNDSATLNNDMTSSGPMQPTRIAPLRPDEEDGELYENWNKNKVKRGGGYRRSEIHESRTRRDDSDDDVISVAFSEGSFEASDAEDNNEYINTSSLHRIHNSHAS